MATKTTSKKPTKKRKTTTTKSTKKSTTKKTTPKKTTRTKTSSKKKSLKVVPVKYLVIATGSQVFWLKNGEILTNLLDLHESLNTMDDDLFSYHANNDYNHFADWVEHILEDSECAKKIRSATNREQTVKHVRSHLKIYVI